MLFLQSSSVLADSTKPLFLRGLAASVLPSPPQNRFRKPNGPQLFSLVSRSKHATSIYGMKKGLSFHTAHSYYGCRLG